jgi:hypothetical protein
VRPESGGRAHPADTEYTRCWRSGVKRIGRSRVALSVGAGPRACPDDSTTLGTAPSQMGDHRGSPLRHCDNMTNGADVSQSATVSRPHPKRTSRRLSLDASRDIRLCLRGKPDLIYGRSPTNAGPGRQYLPEVEPRDKMKLSPRESNASADDRTAADHSRQKGRVALWPSNRRLHGSMAST